MFKKIKDFLLSHEPFRPQHMGMWTRTLYFKHYLKRKIDLKKIKTILDAGCGRGSYTRLISALAPQAQIVGYDVLEFPEWKNYSNSNIVFKKQDLNLIQEKESYDLIISIDSLEHIPNNKEIIKKFYHALRRGGYLYLAIPDEAAEKFIFPREWFKEIDEWAKEEHIGEQYRLWELEDILKEIGFRILYSRYTFTFFGHLAWELETILKLRNNKTANKINIILTPLFKAFIMLDLFFPLGEGNNLLIAKKE